MLTAEQIRDKLYASAGQFEEAYMRKQYAKAKNIYDTAERVALFVDLPQEDRKKLFMNQNDSDERDAQPVWGAFNQDWVRRAYIECIKQNKGFEEKQYKETYFGQ